MLHTWRREAWISKNAVALFEIPLQLKPLVNLSRRVYSRAAIIAATPQTTNLENNMQDTSHREKLQDLTRQMIQAQHAADAINPDKSQAEYIEAINRILEIQESLIALDDSRSK